MPRPAISRNYGHLPAWMSAAEATRAGLSAVPVMGSPLSAVLDIALIIAQLADEMSTERTAWRNLALRAHGLRNGVRDALTGQNIDADPTFRSDLERLFRELVVIKDEMENMAGRHFLKRFASRGVDADKLVSWTERLQDEIVHFTTVSLMRIRMVLHEQAQYDGEHRIFRESEVKPREIYKALARQTGLVQAVADIVPTGSNAVLVRRPRTPNNTKEFWDFVNGMKKLGPSHPNIVQLLGYSVQSNDWPFCVLYPAITSSAIDFVEALGARMSRFRAAVSITRDTRRAATFLWDKKVPWHYDDLVSITVDSGSGRVVVYPDALTFRVYELGDRFVANPGWKIATVYHTLIESAEAAAARPLGYGPQDLITYGERLDALDDTLKKFTGSARLSPEISKILLDAWSHVNKPRNITSESSPACGDIGYWVRGSSRKARFIRITSLAELDRSHLPPGCPPSSTHRPSITMRTTLSGIDLDPQPLGKQTHGDGSRKYVWNMGSNDCQEVWIVAKAFQELSKVSGDLQDLSEEKGHNQVFGVLLTHARSLDALAKHEGKRLSDLVIVTAHEVLLKAHAEVDSDMETKSKRVFFYRRPLESDRLPSSEDWGYWSFNPCPPGTRKGSSPASLSSVSTPQRTPPTFGRPFPAHCYNTLEQLPSLEPSSSSLPLSSTTTVTGDCPESPRIYGTMVNGVKFKGFTTNVYAPRPRIHYVQLSPFEAELVLELSRPRSVYRGVPTQLVGMDLHTGLTLASPDFQEMSIISSSGLASSTLGKTVPTKAHRPIGHAPNTALHGKDTPVAATLRLIYSPDAFTVFVIGITVINLFILLYAFLL